MAQNDGKRTLGILTGERVCVCSSISFRVFVLLVMMCTCMAHASVVYLDAHLVGLGSADLDVFNRQIFASLPGYGGL